MLSSLASETNTDQQLKSFGFPNISGAGPVAPFIEGSDGALYGTTPDGGTEGAGVVFKFNKDGSGYAVLHHFTPSTGDGEIPFASVIEASDGKLYGTTQFGGSQLNNYGIVFKMNKDGSGYTNLHSFTDATSDGAQPTASLIEANDGMLYGTTQFGGISNNGSIFRLNKNGSAYTNLHSFIGAPDGAQPWAGVVQGNDGRLYGTTFEGGGSTNVGMVFRLNLNGTGYTNLHSFTYSDGASPYAKLLKATNGVFYGTTSSGGASEYGTVFKITSNGVFTTVYSFNGTTAGTPSGALIEGNNGVLFGTTQGGGPGDYGTVFSMTTNGGGSFTVLRTFTSSTNNDGDVPYAGLVKGTNGVLYGVTQMGGSPDQGTAFKLNQDGTSYAVLRVFNLSGGDGYAPQTRLIEGGANVLYGVTAQGGTNGNGLLFKLNKDGTGYTMLRHLIGGSNGELSPSGIIKASDGLLYGSTYYGGANGMGSIYRLNTNGGAFAVVRSFGTGAGDGILPRAAPFEASDGLLYGTTYYGGTGSPGYGAIYKMNKDGSGYTNLYRFSSTGGDGRNPNAPLVEGQDGFLYGTTFAGGSHFLGTVFKMNKNGSGYAKLHSFTNSGGDGKNPYAGLLKGSDGALYGTTFSGGTNGAGTVYRLSTNGSAYSVLRSFDFDAGEGTNPHGELIEGTNGALYSTTQYGGTDDVGTVFKLNKDGTGFAVLCSFNSTGGDGMNPMAAVVAGADGALYGATEYGGVMNLGSIFKLTLGSPPIISSQPMSSVAFDQDDAYLTASVTGTGPFTYQWYFNGSAIGGANASDLTLTGVTPQMAGSYRVVVANASGSVTSAVAAVSYFRLYVSNNVPRLIFAGPTGLVYGADYRNGLTNAWQSLTNFTLTTSPKTVTDSAGANLGRRFYRSWFSP